MYMALIDRITRWNPWWSERRVDPALLGTGREMEDTLAGTMDLRHIKDIIGIRRSGKTTVLLRTVQRTMDAGVDPRNIVFLNFDDAALVGATFEELDDAVFQHNPDTSHMFVDEVQQKTGWERWMRTLYDLRRLEQVFVSGSSSSLLSRELGRTLTGRHVSSTVYPFSFREYLRHLGWDDLSPMRLRAERDRVQYHLSRYLEYGGFPETVGSGELSKRMVLLDVFKDIMSRDVASRHDAEADKVERVATYLLTNAGKEYTLRSVSRATGVSVASVERYISHLKEALLVFDLELFTYKLKTRFRANKKAYCIDTGLRNVASLRFSSDAGRLAENALFLELVRDPWRRVFYWKSRTSEVDFVITDRGYGVEELVQVCWDVADPGTRAREVRGLVEAMQLFGMDEGTIVTRDHEAVEDVGGMTVRYVPLWSRLLAPAVVPDGRDATRPEA